jgi:hypothetical protein
LNNYSYILTHYKGKYNLSVPYDLYTDEFIRDDDGGFANYHDVRIDCQKGFICHYGGSVLTACFDSMQVKNNIVKKLDSQIIISQDWDSFNFHAKDIEIVAELMGAKVSHKNRSPFSTKNLPKEKYIPNNPELCKELSKLLYGKYGLKGCLDIYRKYFKKYKIKFENEKIRYIYILDKYNKLDEVYEHLKIDSTV